MPFNNQTLQVIHLRMSQCRLVRWDTLNAMQEVIKPVMTLGATAVQ